MNSGTFDLRVMGGAGACIGSGSQASAGDVIIKNAIIRAEENDGACIGSGCGASVGNITIQNSKIEVHNVDTVQSGGSWQFNGANIGSGAGIGSGLYLGGRSASAGDITITGSDVIATSEWGAGIGSGANGSSVGNITLGRQSIRQATSTHAENVGKGWQSTAGTVTWELSRNKLYI